MSRDRASRRETRVGSADHMNMDKLKAVSNDSLFELLSPAGNEACLKAALSAGADAAYAGADRFGARAYAGNFTREGFVRALDTMHLFGRKLYLTLNTLIKEKEAGQLYDFVKPFYKAGLDGVIVQDLGVIRFLSREFPELPIHASTQMSVTTAYGARQLGRLGVKRVVPARELSLKEVRSLVREGGLEVECFIHGAMCYSYSGLCLMSSFLGGRSGNRGRCAGPCRQNYRAGSGGDAYLLSMKDLCAYDLLWELMEAGVRSFKIEGRMKPPEYVYGVTRAYRRAMDRILEGREDPEEEGRDRTELTRLYSRQGVSEGYYGRRNGPEFITMDRPGYVSGELPSLPEPQKLPVRGFCRIRAGEEAYLSVAASGREVTQRGPAAEKAKNRALTAEDILRCLKQCGETEFYFESLDVDTDGAAFLPVSGIKEMRRGALESLKEAIIGGYQRSL